MIAIGPDAFTGRDAEFTAYRELLSRAASGHGGALLMDGEPGIGKSALLDAQLRLAGSRGCTVLPGRADDLTRQFPMRVMLDCLGRDSLTGVSEGPPEPEQVLAAVADRCARAPVVLAVDDLQWADERSLRTWQRLAELAPGLPLVVLGTWAPVPHRPELARLREDLATAGQAVLSLGPLGPAEAITLAGLLAGGEPGDQLKRLTERAGGNPLYITELVSALANGERLRVVDGVADIVTGRPPQSLATVITRPLNVLSPPSNRVLRFAILVGPRFTAAEVAAVAGLTTGEVSAGLAEARQAGMIEETEGGFDFRPPLMARALYDSVPRALRAALHRQAAQSLAAAGADDERVAGQLLAATPMTTTPWSRNWLLEAAPRLAQRAPGTAAALLRQAMADLAPEDHRRDRLGGALAAALLGLGQYEEAADIGWPLLARDADPRWRAEVVRVLACALLGCGREHEAVELIADTLAGPGLDLAWQARLRAAVAHIHLMAGRPAEAGVAARQALTEAQRAGDNDAASRALYVLGLLRVRQADNAGARDLVSQALALVGDDQGSAELRCALLVTRMTACQELGEMTAAEADLAAVGELAGDGGIPLPGAYAVAEYYLRAGRWNEALEQLDSAAGSPVALGYPAPGASDPLRRAIGALIGGHRDDRAVVAVFPPVRANAAGLLFGQAACLLLAEALAAERDGRPADALAVLRPALDAADPVAARLRAWGLPTLVRLALAADRTDFAEEASARAEQAASQEPTPLRHAIAGHCRGLVVRDPALVLAALAAYRDIGLPLEHAQAAEDAAELLALAGQAGQARQRLTEAIDGYTALRAEWDVRRADSRLRRYGVRRGRGRSAAPGALTSTEAKIAELIARGWSTPDIAKNLVLSPRTVQTHIAHIMRKLNSRSRIDIARASITAVAARDDP